MSNNKDLLGDTPKAGPKKTRGRTDSATEDAIQKGGRDRSDEELERMMQRKPLGVSLQLDVPSHLKEDGYTQFWALDQRVDKLLMSDWDFVKDKQGGKVTRPSGPNTLFLMQLPTVVFDHMEKLQQEHIHQLTKAKVNEGMDYVPDGRESAVTVERY